MYHRRRSPYSRIEDIQRSRRELLGLVLGTVALGLLLGLLGNAIYDLSTFWLAEPGWLRALWIVVLIILGVGLVSVVIAALIWRLYMSSESRRVRVDIGIPYYLPRRKHLEVAKQHPFRPRYQAANLARLLFHRGFAPQSSDNQGLAAAWREVRSQGTPFQSVVYDLNADLVDALLTFALHRHSEESLSTEAKYGWWQVNLPRRSVALDKLPERLSDNRFLKALLGTADDWKLILPENLKLRMAEYQEDGQIGRTLSLIYARRGGVSISLLPQVWVAKRTSLLGQALSEGIALDKDSDFFVIGTHMEAQATFRYTFLRRTDPFHQWATDLLARLEEELDCGYYLETRPHRMTVDLPWKIGDLPADASIWKKLEEIEERMERIESKLSQPARLTD